MLTIHSWWAWFFKRVASACLRVLNSKHWSFLVLFLCVFGISRPRIKPTLPCTWSRGYTTERSSLGKTVTLGVWKAASVKSFALNAAAWHIMKWYYLPKQLVDMIGIHFKLSFVWYIDQQNCKNRSFKFNN